MRTENSPANEGDQRGDEQTDSLRVRRRAQATSGIRFDKIEEICRAIAAGDYQFDADRIAEKILDRLGD